jgi:hypothetical protein
MEYIYISESTTRVNLRYIFYQVHYGTKKKLSHRG